MPRKPLIGGPLVEPADDDLPTLGRDGIGEQEVDVVEVLSAGMADALETHRGRVYLDGRYHCLCGWVSIPADSTAAILSREDVRRHLVAAQWVGMSTVIRNA